MHQLKALHDGAVAQEPQDAGLVAQAGEELGALLVLGDRGVQELDRHLPGEAAAPGETRPPHGAEGPAAELFEELVVSHGHSSSSRESRSSRSRRFLSSK